MEHHCKSHVKCNSNAFKNDVAKQRDNMHVYWQVTVYYTDYI